MELSEVKKQINAILEKENIKHVFHVDDRATTFQKKKETLLAELRRKDLNQDENLIEILLSEGIDTEGESDFIINEIEEKLSIENIDFVKKLLSHFGKTEAVSIDEEDNDAFDIKKYFYDGKFTALEPKRAITIMSQKIDALNAEEGKILVLFDLDLKEAGEEFIKITGVELLIQLKEVDKSNRCVCSIFTHLVKTTNEEIEKRKRILEGQQGKLKASNLFVLSKKRKNDFVQFGDGIKKAVLNPIYESVKDKSVNLLKKAFEESCAELESIDTYEFDHIILHASNAEGVWAGETLLRIFNVIFDKNVRNKFIQNNYAQEVNPFFEKAIKLARHTFPLEQKDIPDFNRNRIRNLELYTNDDIVNGLYEPINNGDIFEIASEVGKECYVLIGQECDLILRSNGKRNRNKEFFTLLKIDFKSKADVQKEIADFASKFGLKNTYFSNKFLLNNYSNEDTDLVGVVSFGNELTAYVSILDLVSFNNNGEAKFKFEKDYPLYSYSQSLRHRFEFVKQICQKRTDFLKNTEKELKEQGVIDTQTILNRLIESVSPTNKLIGNQNSYSEEEGFDFGVKRVKRLKTHWANRLLERYGYYLSRAAELPDYADYIEPKSLKV